MGSFFIPVSHMSLPVPPFQVYLCKSFTEIYIQKWYIIILLYIPTLCTLLSTSQLDILKLYIQLYVYVYSLKENIPSRLFVRIKLRRKRRTKSQEKKKSLPHSNEEIAKRYIYNLEYFKTHKQCIPTTQKYIFGTYVQLTL